jgi:hypothetical protein
MRREKDSSPSFNSSYHVEGTNDFAAFELSERICSVVRGLRGEHFHGMELITTTPTTKNCSRTSMCIEVLGVNYTRVKKNSADYLLVCGVLVIFAA